jgi:hypothetical protein
VRKIWCKVGCWSREFRVSRVDDEWSMLRLPEEPKSSRCGLPNLAEPLSESGAKMTKRDHRQG